MDNARPNVCSPATKRKAINDFFLPVAKHVASLEPKKRELEESVSTLSKHLGSRGTSVPGLTLHPDFITSNEECNILAFLNDTARCVWRTDLSRRTMHFGGTYCLMPTKTEAKASSQSKPKILQAPPMPEEFAWLIQRMVDAAIFPDDKRPQYCIVNEYTANLGISAHTENFQFGAPVVGLSLLSACPIRFLELREPYDGSVRSGKAGKAEKTGRREDVELPGRSLMVMRGESRWRWQHEILRSKRGRGAGWKRVSLTFRYKPVSHP